MLFKPRRVKIPVKQATPNTATGWFDDVPF